MAKTRNLLWEYRNNFSDEEFTDLAPQYILIKNNTVLFGDRLSKYLSDNNWTGLRFEIPKGSINWKSYVAKVKLLRDQRRDYGFPVRSTRYVNGKQKRTIRCAALSTFLEDGKYPIGRLLSDDDPKKLIGFIFYARLNMGRLKNLEVLPLQKHAYLLWLDDKLSFTSRQPQPTKFPGPESDLADLNQLPEDITNEHAGDKPQVV